MSLTTSEILERAAELIEPPGRWTTQFFARDDLRHATTPLDENACSWCGEGAIARVMGVHVGSPEWCDVLVVLDGQVGEQFSNWQDDEKRTQSEVVQALRDAAAASL